MAKDDQFSTKRAQPKTRKHIAEQMVRNFELNAEDTHRTTVKRETVLEPRIRRALKVLGRDGELYEAGSGREILEIKNPDIISKYMEDFSPTANTLQRSHHTFALRSVTRGHRKTVTAVSCELEDYIGLCKSFNVTLPESLAHRAVSSTIHER